MIDGEGDRLVLTQDGNQRIRNEWSFRQRDALGRESLTAAAYGSGYSGQDDYSRSYTYDLNGNLEGRDDTLCSEQWTSVSGNAPASWSRTALPPSNVTLLEEGYAYDAAGNRTAVLDAEGDTLSVTPIIDRTF